MKELTAKDVMNADVLVVTDDMTVGELAAFLIENDISGAPVLDGDERLVGIVSLTDIAAAAADAGNAVPDRSDPEYLLRGWEEVYNPEDFKRLRIEKAGTLVRDIMSTEVEGIPEDTSVATCARMMLSGHHHRLLVTRGSKLLGIITATDMLRLVADIASP